MEAVAFNEEDLASEFSAVDQTLAEAVAEAVVATLVEEMKDITPADDQSAKEQPAPEEQPAVNEEPSFASTVVVEQSAEVAYWCTASADSSSTSWPRQVKYLRYY